MQQKLTLRLERLEERFTLRTPAILHCGWLRNKLSADYTGPRETVLVSCEPTRSNHIFWCQFEERAVESTSGGNRKTQKVPTEPRPCEAG